MAKTLTSPVSDIPFFRFDAFDDAGKSGVAHAFFGRRGGVSSGIYEGLNCGVGSSDKLEDIKANRAAVAEMLGTDASNLLSLYQVHSADCLKVTKPWKERPQADAMVTDVPGLALSILTADCAPVLFTGKKADGKPVIGAAHAGWKGAIGGAMESTLQKMQEAGADLKTIRAAIGPTIQKKSYEVSEGFYETFLKANPKNEKFFQGARKAGHYMFDLPGYCASRLQKAGIKHVYISEADTYVAEGDFYSYRRATHRKEPDYGRQISAIVIL